VPFFARWPGKIRAGSSSDETICLTDFFATAADIVGAALPVDAAEDSFSLKPLLTGEGAWKRAPVIHHSSAGMFAIRDGKWKLIAGNGSGGRQDPKGKPFERPYMLFDLSEDIGERKDVIGQVPDVAQRMEAELERLRAAVRSR
jgi:arylsulfatase A-like enzyme